MNKQKYFIVNLDLETARTKSEPYELRTAKDSLFVLALSGNASISIEHGEFFDLQAGMKILLQENEQKEIEIINESQESKSLVLFLGTQKKCQISL